MFNINQKAPIYDPEAVQPMRDELLYVGFEEATTPQKVEELISNRDDKAVFVFINSVCGCAAGSARPAAALSLQNDIIPDRLVTVFAGQDREAVDHLRNKYLSNIPPSSPFMALFKNGEVVYTMPRHHIEGRDAEDIANELQSIFNKQCKAQGPSISPDKYAELVHAVTCGSKIPLNRN
ncbi:MAG: BrxA/BrxB family bacilliredoxin [Ignavibacteriales bacterium]|nr:BrxA/BrxB family bacilliredoxin [Ignavibacteriales bacterium]